MLAVYGRNLGRIFEHLGQKTACLILSTATGASFIVFCVCRSSWTNRMNLDAFFTAPQPIPFHRFSAATAIVLGATQLAMRKGGNVHRFIGRLWLVLMALVAMSSLFIHEINLWGRYSPIHLLSMWTLVSIGLTVYFARSGNIIRHRQSATVFCWLALIMTGFFTLLPGRITYEVLLTGG